MDVEIETRVISISTGKPVEVSDLPVDPDSDAPFFAAPGPGGCKHLCVPYNVDLARGICTCSKCKATLSPFFVLQKLMSQESLWRNSGKRAKEAAEVVINKRSCKCIHCGKMTTIPVR